MSYRITAIFQPLRRLPAGTVPAVGAVGVWSTNAVAAQYALERTALWPVLVAMTGGATAALLAVRVRNRRPTPATDRPPATRRVTGWTLGLVGLGGTLVLQYVAFDLGPLLDTNVTSYGWPMFAALAVAAARRTRTELWGLACALVGFAGVALMFAGSGGAGGGGPWGYLAALGSALCMAGYTLAVGRIAIPAAEPLLVGAIAALAVAGTGLVLSGAGFGPWPATAAAVYCGLGPVATGYLLWSRAMVASDSRLAPLGYAIPLVSTGLLVATGAALGVTTAIGAVLVVACTTGVLLAGRRREPRPDVQPDAQQNARTDGSRIPVGTGS